MLKQASILKNMRHLHGITDRFNLHGDSSPKKALILNAKFCKDEDEGLPSLDSSFKRVEKY